MRACMRTYRLIEGIAQGPQTIEPYPNVLSMTCLTDLCSSWDIHGLLILGGVPCSDFDILSVCAVRSPGASNNPLAFAHMGPCSHRL